MDTRGARAGLIAVAGLAFLAAVEVLADVSQFVGFSLRLVAAETHDEGEEDAGPNRESSRKREGEQ